MYNHTFHNAIDTTSTSVNVSTSENLADASDSSAPCLSRFGREIHLPSRLLSYKIQIDASDKDTRLTLVEEVLLLGLNDRGYISILNDHISNGLRGCILIELALRGRIQLEKQHAIRKSLLLRKVQCKHDAPTGDAILDEALTHIKRRRIDEGIQVWIDLLSGDSWNPSNSHFQLLNIRERVVKNLVEKGVLTTGKQNFVLFDMTTHPLSDKNIKTRLVKRIQDAVLFKCPNDVSKIDRRTLALIYLAHASSVLENAFQTLSDEDYDIAKHHVRFLLDLDVEEQSSRNSANELLWGVVADYRRKRNSWL